MSMASMPFAAMSASSPAWSFLARMPPCTLGCSVFTRPPMISGCPVTSLTSVTSRPASRSVRAVPPVEMSCTPSAASPRARSTSPVLSDTDSSARRDATS